MNKDLWLTQDLSKLLPQCADSPWDRHSSDSCGTSQYEINFQKGLKAHTHENLDDNAKLYIKACLESKKIAKQKGCGLYDTEYMTDEQIQEIIQETRKSLQTVKT